MKRIASLQVICFFFNPYIKYDACRSTTISVQYYIVFLVFNILNTFLAKRQRKEDKIEITVFESNQQNPNDPVMNAAAVQPVKLQGELDDPEIELTDGPVTVRVDHTTRQFYITNYKKVS